jgi:hypothetical protein
LNTTIFFFVPRLARKPAASTQALISLGSSSPHPAHLKSLSSLNIIENIIALLVTSEWWLRIVGFDLKVHKRMQVVGKDEVVLGLVFVILRCV